MVTPSSTNISMNEKPNQDDLRVKQLEDELARRERLTVAAEKEIGRVWDAYSNIAKVVRVFLLIVGIVVVFLGVKTLSDLQTIAKNTAQGEVDRVRKEVTAELDRQFAKEEIQKLITEKAKERIELTAGPLVKELIETNILPAIMAASNRLEEVNAQLVKTTEMAKPAMLELVTRETKRSKTGLTSTLYFVATKNQALGLVEFTASVNPAKLLRFDLLGSGSKATEDKVSDDRSSGQSSLIPVAQGVELQIEVAEPAAVTLKGNKLNEPFVFEIKQPTDGPPDKP